MSNASYDSIQLGGQACRVVYFFANDKLARAKYVFDAEHRDSNDFILTAGSSGENSRITHQIEFLR